MKVNATFIRSCWHHALTIINSASVNIGVQIFPEIVVSFPSDIYSEAEFLDHMVVLFLIFLGHLHTIVHSSCTRLHSKQCTNSLFSTSPTPCLFDDNHSNRCEVASHYGFDLHFPDDKWFWTPSHVYFFAICMSSKQKKERNSLFRSLVCVLSH